MPAPLLLYGQSLEDYASKIGDEGDRHGEIDLGDFNPLIEDSRYGFDVEKFIYGLTYQQTVVLLFLSMGFGAKDIKKILHLKNEKSFHRMKGKLRKLCKIEGF